MLILQKGCLINYWIVKYYFEEIQFYGKKQFQSTTVTEFGFSIVIFSEDRLYTRNGNSFHARSCFNSILKHYTNKNYFIFMFRF